MAGAMAYLMYGITSGTLLKSGNHKINEKKGKSFVRFALKKCLHEIKRLSRPLWGPPSRLLLRFPHHRNGRRR